jgi:ribosomal protein S18 acetylase RimI-like enzyme
LAEDGVHQFQIVQLSQDNFHLVKGFDCGNEPHYRWEISEWLTNPDNALTSISSENDPASVLLFQDTEGKLLLGYGSLNLTVRMYESAGYQFRFATIDFVGVHKDCQRRKIGPAILAHMIEEAIRIHGEDIVIRCRVHEDNDASLKICGNAGFRFENTAKNDVYRVGHLLLPTTSAILCDHA